MDRAGKRILALFFAFFLLLLAAVPAKSPLRRDILLPPVQERSTAGDVLAGGIDLNTADAETLMRLPGIGRVLADRIVDWREENGPFRSAEELLLINGIGEKTLKTILAYSED